MKVIITGGAGFIGSNLTEFLIEKNFEITIIDNFSTGKRENISRYGTHVELIKADISKKGKWTTAFKDANFVVHLAAIAEIVPSINNPREYFSTNVSGTLNVLEAVRKSKIRKLIYAASSSCYGIPSEFPTKEDSPLKPMYPYALTKMMGEQIVEHWSAVYKIPAISLRLFNVYGPRARTSGTYGAVLGVFLAQKLAGKPLTIVGDGKQTRDFTYVSDVVNAIYMSLISKFIRFEKYNVGSGTTVSVNTLAAMIGGDVVAIPKRPGEPGCTFADITKIGKDIGWHPSVSINVGLSRLLKDLDHWKTAPVWDPESIEQATQDWFRYLG